MRDGGSRRRRSSGDGGPSPRQTGLPLAERRRNVRDAFAAADATPTGRVLLVDDVYTTGATVDAAARGAAAAGASHVEVVTFARAIRGVRRS